MKNPYEGTKTEKNLMEAFAGESMARNKYTYFASVAKKAGYEQIAALFLKTAENEKEHAKLWFKYLEGGDIKDTLSNLNDAAAGENYEWTDMYDRMAKEPSEERLHKCGVLEIDDSDRIVSMEEKPAEPKSHWVCPPFYYYTAEDAARIPAAIADGCGTDAPGSFIAWLCRHTAVHAMEMPGRRYDIGNLQSYEEVQQQYPGIVK